MDKKITTYPPTDTELAEYKEVIRLYGEYMLKELIDNHDKGGRSASGGWLWVPPKQILGEIYYHTGKLQEAIKNNDLDAVLEFSADVGNLALMVIDMYVHLTSLTPPDLQSHPIITENDTI